MHATEAKKQVSDPLELELQMGMRTLGTELVSSAGATRALNRNHISSPSSVFQQARADYGLGGYFSFTGHKPVTSHGLFR